MDVSGFGYAPKVIFSHIILNMPESLTYLIAQYAAHFPVAFKTVGRARLYALLPSSQRCVHVKGVIAPKGFIFHSFNSETGVLYFEYESEIYALYNLCVNGKNDDALHAMKIEVPLLRIPKSHLTYHNRSEYIVKCNISETTWLQLEFSWCIFSPSINFVCANEYKKLKWEFPSETAAYDDGWITQLHYFNNQLLLITDNAIYIASYDPLSYVCLREKDWKFVSKLPKKI